MKSRLYTLTGGAEHFSISLALWYLMILATIGNKRLFLGRCVTHMTEVYASFRLNYLSHLRRRFDDISTYYKAQSSESEVRAISLQDSYNKGTRQDDRSKKYLGLSWDSLMLKSQWKKSIPTNDTTISSTTTAAILQASDKARSTSTSWQSSCGGHNPRRNLRLRLKIRLWWSHLITEISRTSTTNCCW